MGGGTEVVGETKWFWENPRAGMEGRLQVYCEYGMSLIVDMRYYNNSSYKIEQAAAMN